jgi:hypothetical protein
VKPTKTTTTTQTGSARTRTEALSRALDAQPLDDKLEQILRMRHGVSEGPEAALRWRGQGHEETRIKLAMMEREYLNELREATTSPDLLARKQRIVDKLRDL